MNTVRVNLGPRSYSIRFAEAPGRSLSEFVRESAPRAKSALLVADTNTMPWATQLLPSLWNANLRTAVATVPAGEGSKSLIELARLYDALAELPADRQTLVVAVGGGMVGDLAGFAAATYNRGVPLLMLPTTLLAMVDSSVGGKTGINHPRGKNLIGAFHQPAGVWIDVEFLITLPDREYRSGFAEVVKYGMIADADFFAWLEAHTTELLARNPAHLMTVVAQCCRMKADVVEQDEREETGLRATLNYGHTFAHAYETAGGYGHWLHGEAVSAGMVSAAELACRLGRIARELCDRQRRLLQAFSLPTAPLPQWDRAELIATMRRDKKAAAGELRFILPTRLGHVELVDDVPEALVYEVLATA